MSQIWIFKKNHSLIGYVLKEKTIMATTIPREEVKEVQYSLKQAGIRIPTTKSALPIIHASKISEKGVVDSKTAYAAHVGRALMNTFFGDEWDPEIPVAYPPNLPEFTKRVLEETRKIPKGKVATYGEIADRIGSPSRATVRTSRCGSQCGGEALYGPLSADVARMRVLRSVILFCSRTNSRGSWTGEWLTARQRSPVATS